MVSIGFGGGGYISGQAAQVERRLAREQKLASDRGQRFVAAESPYSQNGHKKVAYLNGADVQNCESTRYDDIFQYLYTNWQYQYPQTTPNIKKGTSRKTGEALEDYTCLPGVD